MIMCCVVLIPLAIYSAYTCHILLGEMKFGGLKEMRCKIKVMEFMIQTILVSRIAMTFLQQTFDKPSIAWAIFMMCYFIFSELIPFMIIAFRLNRRQKNKASHGPRQEKKLNELISEPNATS